MEPLSAEEIGKMLDEITEAEGVSPKKFRKALQKALNKAYTSRDALPKNGIPTVDEFLAAYHRLNLKLGVEAEREVVEKYRKS